jgi:multidrug resistance efflux pump
VRAVVADVCEFEQVEAVAQSPVGEYGRLDTWVHLAAVGLFAPFDQTVLRELLREGRLVSAATPFVVAAA